LRWPSRSFANAARLLHGRHADEEVPESEGLSVGRLREIITTTLTKMARGGMYDHLGGGFARYSVDARWLVPHFEKMLYDNALLARAYLHAWQVTGEPMHRRVVEETLGWVEREMTSPEGGFYSSLDADSEGEEGKFYVWTPAQLRAALGPDDAEFAAEAFHVTQAGTFERGTSVLQLRSLRT